MILTFVWTGPGGFYAVYEDVFMRINESETEAITTQGKSADGYPAFGNSTTERKDVLNFYNCWENFVTALSFAWEDQYNTADAPNRQIRRLHKVVVHNNSIDFGHYFRAMEKENSVLREAAKKEYFSRVRALVSYVKKRDMRMIQIEIEIKQKKADEEEKRKQKK